ncbi:MAG: hypothetical protein QME51_11765, partial [Planctomycetota bacterium]|nr:hypothetical protein [Planctomycetota bacterium]
TSRDYFGEELVQKLCHKNQWQLRREYRTAAVEKYCLSFRFFEILKPLSKSAARGEPRPAEGGREANLLVLIIPQDQSLRDKSEKEGLILHQTITFEEIETREQLYPENRDTALSIATIKEQLSKDYHLWSPYYKLSATSVEEDRDNLLWRITFRYIRPSLIVAPVTVIDENETPPLRLVPEQGDSSLPRQRLLSRTITLTHPLKLEIERLIALLGDEKWSVRENATNKLISIGRPAIPLLKSALKHLDPEVRIRAEIILKQLK